MMAKDRHADVDCQQENTGGRPAQARQIVYSDASLQKSALP
jgi:hypothetical protein